MYVRVASRVAEQLKAWDFRKLHLYSRGMPLAHAPAPKALGAQTPLKTKSDFKNFAIVTEKTPALESAGWNLALIKLQI